MFDIGFWEMMIVGIVALIVVGPNDLPKMFRTVGKYVGQAKGMARQFQSAMNQAARDSELSDVKSALDGVQSGVKAATDPLGQATKSARTYAKSLAEEWDPTAEAAAERRAQAAKDKAAKQDAEPHFEDAPAEVPQHDTPPRDVTPAAEAEPQEPAEARKD